MADIELEDDVQEVEPIVERENLDPGRNISLEAAALQALEKEEQSEQAKSEEEPKEVSEVKEISEDAKDKEKPTKEEDDGYFADEIEAEPAEEVPEQVKDEWKNLTPLQRYLADQIQPITIEGTINGKTERLQIYAVENIPANFEFNSRADERLTLVNLDRMERKAERLEQEFNSQEQRMTEQKFKDQENADIRADIAELQREGELQTFTRGTDVDNDPKAETAREVLDYYNKENTKRLEQSNREGRLFHRLSYKDAYYLWKAQNAKVGNEQKAEDNERKEITRRAARGQRQGSSSSSTRKFNLPRNANWDQVINAAMGE